MQSLELSGAVQPIYGSLGVKRLKAKCIIIISLKAKCIIIISLKTANCLLRRRLYRLRNWLNKTNNVITIKLINRLINKKTSKLLQVNETRSSPAEFTQFAGTERNISSLPTRSARWTTFRAT